MTLLAEDPALWDAVFTESPRRVRFVSQLARRVGTQILDVGCATGSLCRALHGAGAQTVGLDINPRFVAMARSHDAGGQYRVGDMRTFRLRQKFDLLVCMGTTFSYNLTNRDIQMCLRNFRAHLGNKGSLILDVLNAAAFMGPRPFRPRTEHEFSYKGVRAVATIHHRLHLQAQTMSEQVSWVIGGRRLRRDPPEELRLFFPQELSSYLEMAGFDQVILKDAYGRASPAFTGRRLIAIAQRGEREKGRR